MVAADLELDDLLAETAEEADLAAEDDTATAAAHDAPAVDDLEALLEESMALQAQKKRHKDNLKKLRTNAPMSSTERKQAVMEVLEWETLRVWETTARVSKFNVLTCAHCLRQTTVPDGQWLEQTHTKLKARRLRRLPSVHELASSASDMMKFKLKELPHYRLNIPMDIDQCGECAQLPVGHVHISFTNPRTTPVKEEGNGNS